MSIPLLAYNYVHSTTEASTGYFSCEPSGNLTFDDGLKRLAQSPNDTFLHRYLLGLLREASPSEKKRLLRSGNPTWAALAAESILLSENDETSSEEAVSSGELEHLRDFTPLPYLDLILRERLSGDQGVITAWNELFRANMEGHHPLPHPDDIGLPLPHSLEKCSLSLPQGLPTLKDLTHNLPLPEKTWERVPAQHTAAEALMNLAGSGILAGMEMRHEASLSPVGLLRNWNVDVRVEFSSLAYTLQGEATTWGRGTSLAAARASYAMEMVERASAYLSCTEKAVSDRMHPLPLVHANFTDLVSAGHLALSPDSLSPAVPYRGQRLWWTTGTDSSGNTIFVPVQAAGLFCNLDESELFLSPGSTGLASGNTLEEARLAALLELLERDAEAVMPWRRDQCFILTVSNTNHHTELATLLADYKRQDIHVWFRDMTTEFGVPCFQGFVSYPDGTFAKGAGSGLSAADALLSAMTEIPYPYPGGPASAPPPAGLPARDLSDNMLFPDCRRASASEDLALLEQLLTIHGYPPCYVDLTREDLEFPVVRAIVPGLESSMDFDRFSSPSVRLFRNVLHGSRYDRDCGDPLSGKLD